MDFLEAALAWEGTPWAPSGAVKGKRSNCIGFLVHALEDAGHEELARLARPWVSHQVPPEPLSLSKWCEERLTRVPQVAPGDLLLFRFRGTACHMGLLTEPGIVLDCNVIHRKVCRHSVPSTWVVTGAYRL